MDFRYLKHLAKFGVTNIHPGGNNATSLLIKSLNIKDSDKILEIGCGTGETMVKIVSRYNVTVYGLDVLPEMLKAAASRINFTGLKDRIKIYDVSKESLYPFPDEYFDRIYTESALCFHEPATLKKILTGIHRLLKQDGIYAANEAIWKNNATAEIIRNITGDAERDFGLRPSSKQPMYLNDWKKLFNEYGFDVISCDELSSQKSKIEATNNFKIILSGIYTSFTKAKTIVKPSAFKEYLEYKRILKNHSMKEPVLEGRLFVMKKSNFKSGEMT